MQLATYLGLLCRAEYDLAVSFRQVAEGHADEPDVYHLCRTLAGQCEGHVEALRPHVRRYGESVPEEPDRLREVFFHDGAREGSLGFLRDLQDLYMMAQEAQISWTVVGQAAQGLGDIRLAATVDFCEAQTRTQIRWLTTRMKQAAPQTLIVG